MRNLRLAYDSSGDCIVGAAWVDLPTHSVPVVASQRLGPLARELANHFYRQELARAQPTDRNEVGFVPKFLKKAWKGAWDKAKKVAKAVGVTKVIQKVKNAAKKAIETAGKVIQHPAFAAAIGITAAVVPGAGPVIAAGYAGVRAAMKLAEGVSKGDPRAMAEAGKRLMDNTAGGQKVAALLKSVAPTSGVPLAQNPWLQGLSLV